MSSVLKKARLNVANGSPMSSPVETVKLLPATAKGDATSLGEAARGEGDTDTKDAVLTASLAKLRELLRQHGVSAYLIETQDAHQSEYVSDHDKRRAWLTGFNGSAGTALVTMTKALLWTDGRYFLQAGQQLESYWTLMRIGEHGVPNLEEWVAQEAAATRDVSMSRASLEKPGTGNNFDAGGLRSDRGSGTFKLGVDPWLLSAGTARSLSAKLAEAGGSLVTITGNLVDQIWTDQPPVSCQPVHVHPLEYAGVDVPEKLAMVRELLLEARASSMVVMALDEVAWLFNVRGSDVSFNPVPLSAALLTQDSAYLFMDSHKLGDGVMEHLEDAGVVLRPYDALLPDLRALYPPPALGAETLSPPARVLMSPTLNLAVRESVPASMVVEKPSPIALAKALKNDHELQGLRNAHIRDGVALTSFFSWLERAIAEGEAGNGGGIGWPLTEYSVAEKLADFRRVQEGFVSLSFETISGYGPNGAVIHYAVEEGTARELGTDSLFLVSNLQFKASPVQMKGTTKDSGAQYRDGTTDVTRTLHFGEPTAHQRRCFTLVLKGHIALARAVFPENTMGSKLDVLARMALWEHGLDYRHGTGHGVGAFLNVHEGPHGIHCRITPNEQGIKIGMTTSNEPGYYEDGSFGLRIESICICVEKETAHNFGGKRSCTFETITMAPIQAKLVEASLLTTPEREWLDDYHATVLDTLGPLLKDRDMEAYQYLVRETRPIGSGQN